MKSCKKITSYIFILLFIFFALPVHAEKINDFQVKIDIQKDGKIKVEEKILYDFETASKHGIYREIPTVKTNKDGKNFRMDLNVASVVDENNAPYNFSTSYIGSQDNLNIKIGDANIFVTGPHTYIINYEVGGAITYFSDHDELYWNITGNNWDYPIEKSSVEILLPGELKDEQIKTICYTGISGSTTQNCSLSSTSGKVIGSTSTPLSAQEGFTTVVSFPVGLIAHLEPKPVVNFFDTWIGKITLLILGLAAFFWYIVLPLAIPIVWWTQGRDPKAMQGEVRAWFDPPVTQKGRALTPAEVGTLVDESADTRDVFAAIIDLARRGYFKIVEKKKGDFSFIKQKNDDISLQPYEKELLDGIFEVGDKEVRLKDLEIAETVDSVKNNLYKSLTSEGFFPQNPQTVRTIWMVIAVFALFTGNFFLAIVAFVFGRVMPKKTLYGVNQANVGKSLKNFLISQERQLEFQAKNQMFFEKLLPYAIAFGVEKVWAQRFKDITLNSPDWYQGYNNRVFTTAYLIGSLNSSYSSFRSSATPTTSSSGFSSGFSGGSSGGGGGGGGGGSW